MGETLELHIEHPDNNGADPFQKYLLGPGDTFRIAPDNGYYLVNNAFSQSCWLTQTVLLGQQATDGVEVTKPGDESNRKRKNTVAGNQEVQERSREPIVALQEGQNSKKKRNSGC
jgi:hypothetical protein